MTNPELDPKEKVAIEAMIQKEVDYEFNRIVLELENYRETEVDMEREFWANLAKLEGIDPNTLDNLYHERRYVEGTGWDQSYASRSWDGSSEIFPDKGEISARLIVWDRILKATEGPKDVPPMLDKNFQFKVSPSVIDEYKSRKLQLEKDMAEAREERKREYQQLLNLSDQYKDKELRREEWDSSGLRGIVVHTLTDTQTGEISREGDMIRIVIWDSKHSGVKTIYDIREYGKPNNT